jgi:hypothetical protein
MRSSTSPHGSFNHGLIALLFTGVVGAPLIWLAALQTGYTLAYQACDERSKSWVLVPTVGAIAIVAVITLVCTSAYRRARGDRLPMPLLGWMAVAMASLMVIVLIASAIAPIMLQPCD